LPDQPATYRCQIGGGESGLAVHGDEVRAVRSEEALGIVKDGVAGDLVRAAKASISAWRFWRGKWGVTPTICGRTIFENRLINVN
jgi:hypothetical protein